MTEDKHEKARRNIVSSFEFVNGEFWLGVKSTSGETYTVKVNIGCECKYSSMQFNGKLCSHQITALNVLKDLS